MATSKRDEVLGEVERLGKLAAQGEAAWARAFECGAEEAADAFENACQNARVACDKLGIRRVEEADAWDCGWRAAKLGEGK